MSALTKNTHITILLGGTGSERQVSLVSGKAVAQALRAAGYTNITEIDVQNHDFDLPKETELVYIVIHGTFGEDGQLQRKLDQLGVPYTGARAASSAIAFDKAKTKEVLLAAGITTPRSEIISVMPTKNCSSKTSCAPINQPSLPLPFVIKPTCEGSSVGVHIIQQTEDVSAALHDAAQYGDIIVEEFIQGKELTVGIIDGQVLPIIHISPVSGFYDINNKYPWMNHQGSTDYFCPADLPDNMTKEVQQLALQAWQATGVEVYARVDIILRDSDQKPFVIELNTIPGMTPSSLLPKAAQEAGWTYQQLCETIARLSLHIPPQQI